MEKIIKVSVLGLNAELFRKYYNEFIIKEEESYYENIEFTLKVDDATLEEIEGLKGGDKGEDRGVENAFERCCGESLTII